MKPDHFPSRVDRRTAIKWMLAASGAAMLPRRSALAADTSAASVAAQGYGTDPDLVRDYKPGDLWPLTFSDEQRRTAAALCAVVIPVDEESPSAADVGVHDFIDEWISAPYPDQQQDRPLVLAAVTWVNTEAQQRFGRAFAELDDAGQQAIVADVAVAERTAPERTAAAATFARFRHLAAGGYFTTPEGMAYIGYVGNRPALTFDGPSAEVITKLQAG